MYIMPAGSIKVPQIIPLRPPQGNRKHIIDSNTEIDIRLANKDPDVSLFYTLNNERPNPFQVFGEKFTRKFEYPFTLSPGKKTIKVMAMTADKSKESSVVTRTFFVREIEKDKETDNDASSVFDDSLSRKFRHKLKLSSRESNKSTVTPSPPPPLPPLCNKQPSILIPASNRGNLLKCLCCNSLYVEGQAFCTTCGVQLPRLPSSGEDPIRFKVCPDCHSELSSFVRVCHVCDAPLGHLQSLPLLKVQANDGAISGLIQCLHCGMHNDPLMSVCTACDQTLLKKNDGGLPLDGPSAKGKAIMYPIAGSSYLMCGVCGRVNVSDARYCDWCGCKPNGSSVDLSCQACQSMNDWQARYCNKCGEIMKCPLRPEVESGNTLKKPKGVRIDRHQWVPVADIVVYQEDKEVSAWPDTLSRSTQTQGLFYPSEKTISFKKQADNWQRLVKKVSKDRLANLSVYSPGKGMWRAQLDHIITHLKAHAASSFDFQDTIGFCRLGKLTNSSIEHCPSDKDTTITLKLSFTIKGEMDESISPYLNKSSTRKQHQQAILKKTASFIGSGPPHSSTGQSAEKRRRINDSQLISSVENHLLASELAFSGQGRADIVSNLLAKGANPNALDSCGLPVLSLAAAHGHLEAMNILLELGANINVQTKRTGNTPLHEAVYVGPSRKTIIQSLLGHGANPTVKNKESLTPCEVAKKLGHKQLILLFASQLGSSMLTKLLPTIN
ncbi:PREDICTED: double zinc ribbon and ankyrin repeat-containing protein 1-like isoform X1 [Amphimedon queenslandica]|uniref:DZANK-type domain-containing protein n=2 Tax=Amphimedon queenslandica TaxID=400682 RepID=A0AAN0K406_AMPQE|nr:PREDICTED: double zinc ribbon and ankyrin repeat-containing protein 1-like isoform X1 [Amphimedon queenslandica]|eukprot:XP_019864273.1 PREDICTED: double zinc ribbon and ankyrin repeat-containing protein 1-like isoform X1 [Amphimedon queenslandica]